MNEQTLKCIVIFVIMMFIMSHIQKCRTEGFVVRRALSKHTSIHLSEDDMFSMFAVLNNINGKVSRDDMLDIIRIKQKYDKYKYDGNRDRSDRTEIKGNEVAVLQIKTIKDTDMQRSVYAAYRDNIEGFKEFFDKYLSGGQGNYLDKVVMYHETQKSIIDFKEFFKFMTMIGDPVIMDFLERAFQNGIGREDQDNIELSKLHSAIRRLEATINATQDQRQNNNMIATGGDSKPLRDPVNGDLNIDFNQENVSTDSYKRDQDMRSYGDMNINLRQDNDLTNTYSRNQDKNKMFATSEDININVRQENDSSNVSNTGMYEQLEDIPVSKVLSNADKRFENITSDIYIEPQQAKGPPNMINNAQREEAKRVSDIEREQARRAASRRRRASRNTEPFIGHRNTNKIQFSHLSEAFNFKT